MIHFSEQYSSSTEFHNFPQVSRTLSLFWDIINLYSVSMHYRRGLVSWCQFLEAKWTGSVFYSVVYVHVLIIRLKSHQKVKLRLLNGKWDVYTTFLFSLKENFKIRLIHLCSTYLYLSLFFIIHKLKRTFECVTYFISRYPVPIQQQKFQTDIA